MVRLGPTDDATAVTAAQLRGVVERLVTAGRWADVDPDVLIVTDAGYDVTRLAYVLRDLPVERVGRLRSDRVIRLPAPDIRTRPEGRASAQARRYLRPRHLTRVRGEHRHGHYPLRQGSGSSMGQAASPAHPSGAEI